MCFWNPKKLLKFKTRQIFCVEHCSHNLKWIKFPEQSGTAFNLRPLRKPIDAGHVSIKLARIMHTVFPNIAVTTARRSQSIHACGHSLARTGISLQLRSLSYSSPNQIASVRNDRILDLQVRAKSSDILAWRATVFGGTYYRSCHSRAHLRNPDNCGFCINSLEIYWNQTSERSNSLISSLLFSA